MRILPPSLIPFILLSLAWTCGAKGEVVTTFQEAFQLTTPASGWSYLWNSGGPIGDPANYVPLLPNSAGAYTSGGIETIPGPPPGSWVFFGIAQGAPGGHPGEGPLQSSSGGVARYAIAAYSLPISGEFAISGGWLKNVNPNMTGSTDGLDLKVFINDDSNPVVDTFTLMGTGSFVEFVGYLGHHLAGDTIYVAVGPKEIDSFDAFQLQYAIERVPEPNAAILVLTAGILYSFVTCRDFRSNMAVSIHMDSKRSQACGPFTVQ